jgi:hypothetical protein
MFSLFKGNKDRTLKIRVREFWSWYASVAARFHRIIEEGHCADLHPEVSTKIDELFPGFAWEFGPGKKKGDHAFTLSGGGNLHYQLITQYWLRHAPVLQGWDFYCALQPVANIERHSLTIGERKFEPIEFWLTPSLDIEEEKIDLSIWHPMFAVLPERDRWTITFLFLDQVLGEFGTGWWIGHIEIEDKKLAASLPLRELPTLIEKTREEQKWGKYPPGEAFTGYSFKEQHDAFPRGDTIAGTTCNFKLISEFSDEKGEMADPLAGTGADYVYIAFDSAILPKGNQSTARGEIEADLGAQLLKEESGRVLGGACGIGQSYIDLILFDGAASVKVVRDILKRRKLPPETSINFFAKEKLSQRVILR